VRCAIVPPVPVPYREALFAALAQRADVAPRVIYQAARQPGWDQSADWFPTQHAYDAVALRSWQRARAGATPIIWPRGLERELDRVDPDCVVAWEYGPAALRVLRWCRRRRRGLIVFSELIPDSDRFLSGPQLRVHRWVAARARGFIAASSAARERFERLGAAAESIEVALQSADVERFRASASGGEREAGPVRFLCVGRLVEAKNLSVLLDAFAAAELPAEEASLELCGAGPLEQVLRERAARLGAAVRFSGAVAPGRLPAVYARADVFVLVSTHEPFGAAVREAVAAGLPLVCSRTVGAARDLALEGRNAVIVDPTDVAEIAGALRRLAGDADGRERMARESRAVDAEHDPAADVEAWARAIRAAA
jgi:glycosyltransferase involved in cell wall biosynthesis